MSDFNLAIEKKEEIDGIIDNRMSNSIARLNKTSKSAEKTELYHYSDTKGFQGIISSQKIWATHYNHTNDPTEITLADEIIKAKLKSGVADQSLYFDSKSPVNGFGKLGSIQRSVYIASFSIKNNLLSQWRAYADDGNGFSLGLDLMNNKNISRGYSEANKNKWFLIKVVYEEEDQKKLIQEAIGDFMEVNKDFLKFENNNEKEFIKHTFQSSLNFLCQLIPLFIKNMHYSEEEEWRLARFCYDINVKESKFREGRTSLIPYLEFDFAENGSTLPLKEIVCGPKHDFDKSKRALEMFLKKEKVENVQITESDIPYR